MNNVLIFEFSYILCNYNKVFKFRDICEREISKITQFLNINAEKIEIENIS